MHTRRRRFHPLSVVAAGLIFALGLVLIPGHVGAQDSEAVPHPAHIHSGTCAELGDVTYPLTDVGTEGADTGTPMAGHEMGTPASMGDMGSPMSGDMAIASPAATEGETSLTIVAAPLADLAGGGYAINVHESAENIGNYIACGDIAGAADGADVTVQLATLNDSGYSGTATLHDNGDDTTTVTINLMHHEM